MIFAKSPISIHGFSKSEVIEIKADSIFEASKILGQETRSLAKKVLERNLKKAKTNTLKKCQEEIEVVTALSKRGYLKVGGVNYGKRYLDSLEGFSEGVGVSLVEAYFLQKEIQSGCQTLIARNEDGSIAFMHTEENDEDDNTLSDYNYRLVKMTLPDKVVTFFAYPGLCGWGSAFGIDEKNKLVQFVDDLSINDSYNGILLGNAVAAMIFDTGSISRAKILLEKISKLSKRYGFTNGYAVHMIQNGSGIKNFSFEFGDSSVRKIDNQKQYFVQVNMPKSLYFKKLTSYFPPKHSKSWTNDQKMDYLEMTRREARLENICRMSWWDTVSPERTIKTGLKVLAYPYGDLRKYKNKDKGLVYYHTGLPSIWTFAHFIGYMGKKNSYYIGKKTPAPIGGMEYSNNIDENYKYVEEKIWELAKTL